MKHSYFTHFTSEMSISTTFKSYFKLNRRQDDGLFLRKHTYLQQDVQILILSSVILQQSREVESLHLTQVSVPTPWPVGSEARGPGTLGRTSSTGSPCRSSSPSSSALSRTPAAATWTRTVRPRCRHLPAEPPSWASTASASWLRGFSSAPSSGPGTSRTFQNFRSQSRRVEMFSALWLLVFLNHVTVSVHITAKPPVYVTKTLTSFFLIPLLYM